MRKVLELFKNPFKRLNVFVKNQRDGQRNGLGKETTDEEEEHGGDEGELARPACKLLQADQSVRCLWEVQFCFRLRVQVMHAGHFPPAPGNLGERFPGGTSPWGTSSGKTKLVPRGDVPLGDVPPGNDE